MSESNINPEKKKTTNHTAPRVRTGDEHKDQHTQQSQDSHKPTDKSQQPIYKRVIAFLRNKDNQPHVANVISLGMLVITGFLAYYTWQVFTQTIVQTKAANKSADAAAKAARDADASVIVAKQTLKADTAYNNKVYRQSRIDAKAGNDRENKRDKTAESNLKIQNQALDITRDEFKKINEPILTINQITDVAFDAGRDINFSYNIANLGNNPIHIYATAESAKAFLVNKDSAVFYGKPFRDNPPVRNCSFFLTKETPVKTAYNAANPYIQRVVDAFNEGICRIDFWGTIYYTSNIDNIKRRYDFAIIIRYRPDRGDCFSEYEYGKNTEIK